MGHDLAKELRFPGGKGPTYDELLSRAGGESNLRKFVVENPQVLLSDPGQRGKIKPAFDGVQPTGKRRLADPRTIYLVVTSHMADIADATVDDPNLKVGWWNMENCDAAKMVANLDTYIFVARKFHMFRCCEVSNAAAEKLGQALGSSWLWFKVPENSRGQGLAAFVNIERVKVTGWNLIEKVGSVFGIPDQRQAGVLDGVDLKSGQSFRDVIGHLKSMLGGAKQTAPVRRQQAIYIIDYLGEGQPVGTKIVNVQLLNFWKNRIIGRDLSDHGIETAEVVFGDTGRTIIIQGDMNSLVKDPRATDVRDTFANGGYYPFVNVGTMPPTQEYDGGGALDCMFNNRAKEGPVIDAAEVDCSK
jgi:hypothetical protein